VNGMSIEEEFERQQLHFAAQGGDLDEVRRLLAEGHDLNALDILGHTPLHYAVDNEDLRLVDLLLNHGADVNAHANDVRRISDTPLGKVAPTCSLEMAKRLIAAGADPLIPGWMQRTALDRAAERKRGEGPQVYELLKAAAEHASPSRRKPRR
jgi:ankyrin repeat protein